MRLSYLLLMVGIVGACAPEAKTPISTPVSPAQNVRFFVSGKSSRTMILNYHDIIAQRDRKSVWFDCTAEELEEQLDWLTNQGATFLSLDQLVKSLTSSEPAPNNAVVITFADNYLGFYERALPILRRRKIPAAMFVHTDYVGSPIGRPKMTWDQLREIAADAVITIGSQTMSHPEDLSLLSIEKQRKELEGSKAKLEKELGLKIKYLAYPRGKFGPESVQLAVEAGYEAAFTEEQMAAELSPGLHEIARWVHTKYKEAWQECQTP